MATYSKSFTAVGEGPAISVKAGDSFSYSISGTFDATWQLQVARDGKRWEVQTSGTAASSGTIKLERAARYRVVCSVFTSGTMVSALVDTIPGNVTRRVIPAQMGKVGATAGWVPAGTTDVSLATCPAGQTASTLVVPIGGLRVGDVITGFYATGQIESAGNTATLDIALRKVTAATADVVDAAVASITQISVTADATISSANSRVGEFVETVGDDETFYFLITATTGASTDIALQGLVLEVQA